ncbi:MAG: hypothetical protein KJZ54_10895 [Phycisphaerales bacterium]|nr:hypothetical protein [Phycisphaerales bacterium]
MARDPQETDSVIIIGPGVDSGRLPDEPCCADPAAFSAAADEAHKRREGRRLVLRLIVAFALVILLGFVCFVVLPDFGVHLPPIVPIAAFAAIVVGSLLTAKAEGHFPPPQRTQEDEGRPIGCCPGPRPPRSLR